jgi:hypothetical protein
MKRLPREAYPGVEVLEATDPQHRFLDDQQRPALTDDLEGPRASLPTWSPR